MGHGVCWQEMRCLRLVDGLDHSKVPTVSPQASQVAGFHKELIWRAQADPHQVVMPTRCSSRPTRGQSLQVGQANRWQARSLHFTNASHAFLLQTLIFHSGLA